MGARVERGHADGRVHSVFPGACNVMFDDGAVVVFLGADAGNVPHGLRLCGDAMPAFVRSLRPGMEVGIRRGIARFGASGSIVDLRQALIWSADLSRIVKRASPLQVGAAIRQVEAVLAASDISAGLFDDGWGGGLTDGAISCDVVFASDVAAGLIGRGQGLTPAGDDVLVGFLAALFATTGTDRTKRYFLDGLRARIRDNLGRTGAISTGYLAAACEGHFSERLVDLARSVVAAEDGARMRAAAERALASGSTSGRDGVCGLLSGFAAWCRPRAGGPTVIGRSISGSGDEIRP